MKDQEAVPQPRPGGSQEPGLAVAPLADEAGLPEAAREVQRGTRTFRAY